MTRPAGLPSTRVNITALILDMYVALNFSQPDWKENTVQEMADFAATHRERLDRCTRQLEFPRDLYREMGAQGWVGAVAPRAYGGSGGSVPEYCLIEEEVGRWGLVSPQISIQGQLWLLGWGSESQKERYLPGMASGNLIFCEAISEPGVGSSLKLMQTSAKRVGGVWVLDGRKTHVNLGTEADLMIVYAMAEEGLTSFLVDTETKGVTRRQTNPIGLRLPLEDESLAGTSRGSEDVSGYMHTSGTTGKPKFCTQSHRYFLELGRFIANSMALSCADTVFAPLPMFHINPMGYGVVGGLTGGADVLATSRFSARGFWKTVKDNGVTVAFLHSPPVAVLNRATDENDAAGHRLRAVFLADEEFLNKFAVPMGFSGYGSTEAGGLCHIWPWRLAGRHPEGMSRFGGAPRRDVEWDLTEDGEILVRAQRPHILSSGYRTASGTAPLTDENGWFHTGDLGRRDEYGHLVFIERKADSIRVKGEYVPIAFVEEAFAAIYEVEELALWRRDSDLVDQEPILCVVAPNVIPDGKIREVSQSLPRFMRPVAVVRVDALPRNEGVGKINRRLLETLERLEVVELNRQG